MELWLKNGDYVPDGKGGFVQLEGEEALLQRVLFRLCARRGSEQGTTTTLLLEELTDVDG